MPDRRTDLLALIKQHGQPISLETTKGGRRAKQPATLKQGDRSDSQTVKKEAPRTRQGESVKKAGQSKSVSPKQTAALKRQSDSSLSSSEEIPHDLPEVLKQQIIIVNELIELGQAEAEAFKIDDVARIRSIVDQQQEAIDRMQTLERRRAEIDLPVPVCLIERARRLQQINETNRLLARMALSFNKMMQKALGLAPAGSYDEKGLPSALQKFFGRLDASA
jgi:flagellar biosynthesis/type III secretory pathway chaperone